MNEEGIGDIRDVQMASRGDRAFVLGIALRDGVRKINQEF